MPGPPSSRDELLAAAIEVFAERGYDGASLRDIERRAGVGRALVAHHFGTKDQLWRTAMEWLMDRFHDELDQQRPRLLQLPTAARGRVLIGVFVRFHSRYPAFTRLLMVAGNERTDRTKWLVEEYRRRNYDFYHRMVGVAAERAPTERAPTERAPAEDAIGYYLFVGAATLVFTLVAECEAVFGVDPTDERFVASLAEVVGVLFGGDPARAGEPGSLPGLIRDAVVRHGVG